MTQTSEMKTRDAYWLLLMITGPWIGSTLSYVLPAHYNFASHMTGIVIFFYGLSWLLVDSVVR